MSPRWAKATRGRAGDDPATALRDHLVDAAEKLLGEKNVGAITTREIARAAGVSDGVLYNHFADKNELILAALLRRYAQVLGRFEVDLPVPGSATVEANLIAYAGAALDLVAQALPMAAGLISEPVLLHRFMAELHREPFGPQRLHQPIAEYLAGEQRLGRVGDVPIGAVTMLILGPTLMLTFAELLRGLDRQAATAEIPEIIRTLLRGIGP